MTRTWTVCRQYSSRPDGERRWDQAYELLARQAGRGGLPGLPLIAEEAADACGGGGAGIGHPPRPRGGPPAAASPPPQRLMQSRGGVGEYGRTRTAERTRRGRGRRLRAGTLVRWPTARSGYRRDPGRRRRADAVRTEPGEAVLVAQLFDWYLEPQA